MSTNATLLDLFGGEPPFSSLSDAALADLVSTCEVIAVRGGTYLARAGERLDAFYGVVHGALRLARGDATLREFYRGEVVGVTALLADREVPVDVLVVRDSALLRLTRQGFVELTRRHPSVLDAFAKVMGDHLLDLLGMVTAPSARPRGGNITLIALDREPATSDATRGLAELALAEPATTHVTARRVETAVGLDSGRVSEWLSNLEVGKSMVVYESDPTTPAWTLQCVRQSDRLLLVTTAARAGDTLREFLSSLGRGRGNVPRQLQLVLVHPASTELPSGTRARVEGAGITHLHHVRRGSRPDLERVVRRLLGRSIGVALSGGGARGIAHLGVLAALEEARVPIDYICGTSMGSIFAAAAAQGWSVERMRASVRELFGSAFALYDPTLPVSSLLSGKKLDRVMQKYYGDAQIEDLWLPFFCVSTDLSEGALVVHDHGSLWKSVRASCSIPGMFPPIAIDGHLLVDGGLMDNLPVDLLAERSPGSIIAVDVYRYGNETVARPPSRLRALRTRLRGEAASPPLFDILLRATLAGSRFRQTTAAAQLKNVTYLEPPVGSFGILAWRSHAELFDAGYRYALEQLARPPLNALVQRIAA